MLSISAGSRWGTFVRRVETPIQVVRLSTTSILTEQRMDAKRSLPGALVLSLDFELHWGVRDKKSADGPYRENLLGVREAVPALLSSFKRHNVHATWATVGLLFAKDKQALTRLRPTQLPSYANPRLDPYAESVGDDEKSDPLHFAPSLIQQVSDTPGQEIATHTYSHYYCLEPGATSEAFSADLSSAQAAMAELGIAPPKTLVFPRNQRNAEWDWVLEKHGIIAYRGNPKTWAYRDGDGPGLRQWHRAARLADTYAGLNHLVSWSDVVTPNGLCDVRASFYLRPFTPKFQAAERMKIERFKKSISRAAKAQKLIHFWWHPHDFGRHLTRNLEMLDELLALFVNLRQRYGMRSLTMLEAAEAAKSMAA